MFCTRKECRKYKSSCCNGGPNNLCCFEQSEATPTPPVSPSCSSDLLCGNIFYLGKGELTGKDFEYSWALVGYENGEVTALFRTFDEAKEYLDFINNKDV